MFIKFHVRSRRYPEIGYLDAPFRPDGCDSLAQDDPNGCLSLMRVSNYLAFQIRIFWPCKFRYLDVPFRADDCASLALDDPNGCLPLVKVSSCLTFEARPGHLGYHWIGWRLLGRRRAHVSVRMLLAGKGAINCN